MTHLGTVIKNKRKAKDVTQDAIAAKLRMNRTTYASKEQKGNFTEVELKKVMEFLGISEITPIEKPLQTSDALGMIAGKVVQIEAMQRVQLTVLQELFSKALGISNMEAKSIIDKVLGEELQKLKQELQ